MGTKQDIIENEKSKLGTVTEDMLKNCTELKWSTGKQKCRYFNTEKTNNIYIRTINGRLALIHFKFNKEDKNDYTMYRYNDYDDSRIVQESSKDSPYITCVIDSIYALTLVSPRTGLMYINANEKVKLYEPTY